MIRGLLCALFVWGSVTGLIYLAFASPVKAICMVAGVVWVTIFCIIVFCLAVCFWQTAQGFQRWFTKRDRERKAKQTWKQIMESPHDRP